MADKRYYALYADREGRIFDIPELEALGRSGTGFCLADDAAMIPLPDSSDLMMLPGRLPVGLEKGAEDITVFNSDRPGDVCAVAAFLPVGYTRTLLPAYVPDPSEPSPKPLPLYGYTMVAYRDGNLYAAAIKSDEGERWDPKNYDIAKVRSGIESLRSLMKGNRLVEHLAGCSLNYNCRTAQNLFLGRWEAGIPTSPGCNARCLGCISLQPSECCPSPQERIKFIPSMKEISELCIHHLTTADDPIISFGQGCEGEPSLQSALIAESIREVRSVTSRGTINMNTNGGNPEGMRLLFGAGLDSIRVSLISGNPENYQRYYNPHGYSLEDVKETLKAAGEYGVYKSLNLLVLPGFTDRMGEIDSLCSFLDETGPDMIQLRNLNIDPDYFFDIMGDSDEECAGIEEFVGLLKERYPNLFIGNYTRSGIGEKRRSRSGSGVSGSDADDAEGRKEPKERQGL